VVLIEDVAPQRRAIMPLDIREQRGRSARAVGQQVAKTPIADVVRLDSQILDYEVLVAVLQRAFGKPFQRQRNGLVNDQFGCLLPFGRAWPFSATLLLASGIWVRLVQSARLDRWPRRQAFQARDLRAQSLDLRLLLGNHPQQGLHQRRPAAAPRFRPRKHQNRPQVKANFTVIEKLRCQKSLRDSRSRDPNGSGAKRRRIPGAKIA
jgi:hypothetical protein